MRGCEPGWFPQSQYHQFESGRSLQHWNRLKCDVFSSVGLQVDLGVNLPRVSFRSLSLVYAVWLRELCVCHSSLDTFG